MTARAQDLPEENRQFRRWPAPAIGDAVAPIRVWFAPETPQEARHINPVRVRAEREWRRVMREVTP